MNDDTKDFENINISQFQQDLECVEIITESLSNTNFFKMYGTKDIRNQELESELKKKEIERYKKALEFYADVGNWLSVNVGYGDHQLITRLDMDFLYSDNRPTEVGGKLARQALSEVEDE